MAVRAVIDTNIWASALIKGNAKYLVSRDDDVKMDMDVTEFLSGSGISVLSVAKFLRLISKD